MMAGAPIRRCYDLADLGFSVGTAFQLVDDLMDVFGDSESTGKDTWSDFRQGKLTLPVLLTLKRNPSLRERLNREFHRGEVPGFLRERVQEPGILSESLRLVRSYVDRAREKTTVFPVSVYRTGLMSLLEYLTKRDH
jgi:octaprenyl-diphosphate synthase